ncbi:colony stimulating factor 2 [Rhinolophus ferrumequinum]|nr:granulocyte-macrophage colony-stimulating factor [Rhinolophus ferrumequinum]KAF6280551.1 colony stimulating factor 2 [Rhinolophus ferrumequinum]
MWLQNLLLLGTVVCSISAPTRPPSPVTRPFQHVDAIKEALSLLNQISEPAAMTHEAEVVSEMFNPEKPTCLQQRLQLYTQGLQGNLTRLERPLTLIANHYKQHCSSPTETPCKTDTVTIKMLKEMLREFLLIIPLDCW